MPPATYPSPKVQAFAWWRSRPLPKGGERVGRVRTRTAAGSRRSERRYAAMVVVLPAPMAGAAHVRDCNMTTPPLLWRAD